MAASVTAPPPPKPKTDGTSPTVASSKPKSVLSNLGGGFVGYSAIASFIAWQQTYNYYEELGAPWFLKAFSTSRLLMESGVLLTVFLFLGVTAVAMVQDRKWKAGRIAALAIGLGIAGLTATIIGFIGPGFLDLGDIYNLAFAAILLLGMSTALIVAGILSGAMTSEPRPRKLQVWALGILLLLGLWRAPVLAGRSRAARDASPELSALPLVVGPTAPADSGWRLVGILDRKFLMMKPALRREDRRFRVTETFDAYTTTATR